MQDARRGEYGEGKGAESGEGNALDVGEHPRLDAELHGAGDDGRDDLAPEHGARGGSYVVAELEVGGDRESWANISDAGRSAGGRARTLVHGDVAPGFEQHHCDGYSGNRISDDQFRDDAVRGDNCPISEPTNDAQASDTYLSLVCWFVTAWIMPMGTMYTNTMISGEGRE